MKCRSEKRVRRYKEIKEEENKKIRAEFYAKFACPPEGPTEQHICRLECNLGHVEFGTKEEFDKYVEFYKSEYPELEYDELPKTLIDLFKEKTFSEYSKYFKTVYQFKREKRYGPFFFILY